MKPCIRLFLNDDNEDAVFGSGKWKLLEAIHLHGSISKAAESLGRSYRKAWGDIKNAEKGLGQKLVLTVRGGKLGGEARLTDFGISFLNAWNSYYLSVDQYMKKVYEEKISHIVKAMTEMTSNK